MIKTIQSYNNKLIRKVVKSWKSIWNKDDRGILKLVKVMVLLTVHGSLILTWVMVECLIGILGWLLLPNDEFEELEDPIEEVLAE